MATYKYFSGTQELKSFTYLKNDAFAEQFPGVRGVRVDSFSRFAGWAPGAMDKLLPITRVIEYASKPSLHKCDARCRHAKGKNCECSCGGQFHGVDG